MMELMTGLEEYTAGECLSEGLTLNRFEGFEVISQAESSMVESLQEGEPGLFELQKGIECS